MSVKQNLRAEKLSRLLRTSEHDYGVSTGTMLYLSPHELDAMISYIERTPRTTAYGRVLSRDEAARIIGVSLNSGKGARLAMRLDSPDTGDFKETLENCGLSPELLVQGTDHDTAFAAALYVYEQLFLRTALPEFSPSSIFQSFMKLIYDNPTEAAYMVDIAISRNTLDNETIKLVSSNDCKPLNEGVL